MNKLVKFWHEARKTVAAVVTAILGWSAIVVSSESEKITSTEWQMGAVMLATALGVYVVSNKPADDDAGVGSLDLLVGLVVGVLLGLVLVGAHVVHVG